jgi:hypothetical protein
MDVYFLKAYKIKSDTLSVCALMIFKIFKTLTDVIFKNNLLIYFNSANPFCRG